MNEKNNSLPESRSYTSSTLFGLVTSDDDVDNEEDGGLENLMLVLRRGTEDAAVEVTSPMALFSFSSMDWGVTGRVGSFKEALADASTCAMRPLERADEVEEMEEDEEEDEEVQPSLAYMLSNCSPRPLP